MNTVAKELIERHYALAESYRRMAENECRKGDSFAVYMAIKESMAQETKARRLENQYGREVM